ncbi:MAG: site-specific integrase [Pseudomonadota bacterium]
MAYQETIDWQIFDETGQRKYVSESERVRFLTAADHEPPKIRALCYLLAYTGCRTSEALNLKRFHIDPERCVITFQTLKRRKLVFRTVPVPKALAQMLLSIKSVGESVLWAIHRSTAWRWIKRVMQAAEIGGPMATCKGLRHGFGIWAATRSVPPNLIQRWMGHSSATTTAIYLNAVGNEERLFAKRMWEPEKNQMKLAA